MAEPLCAGAAWLMAESPAFDERKAAAYGLYGLLSRFAGVDDERPTEASTEASDRSTGIRSLRLMRRKAADGGSSVLTFYPSPRSGRGVSALRPSSAGRTEGTGRKHRHPTNHVNQSTTGTGIKMSLSVAPRSERESPLRSLLKAITYRITGTVTTALIALAVTGELAVALAIGTVEPFVKLLVYYLHERIWQLVPRGSVRHRFSRPGPEDTQ
jgi:uncharacterized membrane protein